MSGTAAAQPQTPDKAPLLGSPPAFLAGDRQTSTEIHRFQAGICAMRRTKAGSANALAQENSWTVNQTFDDTTWFEMLNTIPGKECHENPNFLTVNFTYFNTNFQQINSGLDNRIRLTFKPTKLYTPFTTHLYRMQTLTGCKHHQKRQVRGAARCSSQSRKASEWEVKSQFCVLNIKNLDLIKCKIH